MAIAGAIASAITACGSSGSNSTSSAPSPIVTSQPTPAATTAALPAGFPDGSFGRADQPKDKLTFSKADGVVTLVDQYGHVTESLTSSGPGQVTFGLENEYCHTTGAYRYATHGHTLTFTVVADSGCPNRAALLTASSWQSL
jgi:hypothetical protein